MHITIPEAVQSAFWTFCIIAIGVAGKKLNDWANHKKADASAQVAVKVVDQTMKGATDKEKKNAALSIVAGGVKAEDLIEAAVNDRRKECK